MSRRKNKTFVFQFVFSLLSVVANGDILNPAMRLLIHQRMLGQFDRILEMITEKMGLRVLGGVRRYSLKDAHTSQLFTCNSNEQ